MSSQYKDYNIKRLIHKLSVQALISNNSFMSSRYKDGNIKSPSEIINIAWT